MEALKMLSIVVVVSFAVAGLGGLLMSIALDPLERLRLRWVAREREAAEVIPR